MQRLKLATAIILLGFTGTVLAAPDGSQMNRTRNKHTALTAEQKEQAKYESSGALGGMAIGALAGGPVGAIFSAAAGSWIGSRLHAAKQGEQLAQELEQTRQQMLSLQEQSRKLQAQNLALNQQMEQRNLQASNNQSAANSQSFSDSELTLHFRTSSSEIEAHYLTELTRFAKLAKSFPGATVEINGFADRRGENANNLALSQKRVQQVEAALRNMGVSSVNYRTSAIGEKQPLLAEDNIENNFFDRRVQLRLVNDKAELLSQTRR